MSHHTPDGGGRQRGLSLVSAPSSIDPVCGMTVDPAHAAGSADYEGKTYYFCSTHCVQQFRADPQRYLHQGVKEPMPAPPPGAA